MGHHRLKAAAGASPADPYFSSTSLLLLGNGTNGGQNNTFVDSSTNNFTVTRNGNTTQGSFSPFSAPDGRWSVYQPSGVDYSSFTTSAGSLFEFTGDYTIELWIFPTVLGSDVSLWVTSNGSTYHALNIDGTNYNIYLNSGTPATGVAHGLSLNVWNHIAMVRSGSTVTLYTNGVSKATFTSSSTHGYSSPTIARYGGGGSSNNVKYISNLRIVKNTAVYTSGFTPPISPLSTISGTSLLTCQGNRFYDASSNGLAATVTGSPAVTSFSPFAPLAEYSNSSNGGSGYFDGSGDYLSIGSASQAEFNFGSPSGSTNNFTIEGWFYSTGSLNSSNNQLLVGVHDNATCGSWGVYVRSDGVFIFGSGCTFTGGGTISSSTWYHFAIVRSGSTLTVYVNGQQVDQQTRSGDYENSGDTLGVGRQVANGNYAFTGYISNLRILKGTAQYTANFTPPTSPLTAITNTSLLLNFTNASILDSTAKNDLETVGDAQISTSVKKFGTGSLKFDGTGDYLVSYSSPTASLMNFGTGDFTIEMWLYFSSTSGNQGIVDNASSISSALSGKWFLYKDSSGNLIFGEHNVGAILSYSWSPSTSTWYFIAVSRSGGTITMFINGTSVASASNSTNFSSAGGVQVGIMASINPLNGYIDDLRITKGVARYTSNFTPPAAQLPVR